MDDGWGQTSHFGFKTALRQQMRGQSLLSFGANVEKDCIAASSSVDSSFCASASIPSLVWRRRIYRTTGSAPRVYVCVCVCASEYTHTHTHTHTRSCPELTLSLPLD